MKPIRLLSALVACALGLAGAALSAADLNVFAAASLSDALREIAPAYEASSGDKLRFNLAGSNALARQIEEGAPADVFFSADEAKMDDLSRAGLIVADTRRALLSNTLVIVVNAEGGAPVRAPADLAVPLVGRLALAEPQTVPAGIYAKAWLQQAGLWKQVIDKIAPTENVRSCLAAVEAGNADAGIVYKTDALGSRKVRVAFEVPLAEGPRIAYPLAAIRESKHPEAAARLVEYLSSPAATAVFVKHGFLVPAATETPSAN